MIANKISEPRYKNSLINKNILIVDDNENNLLFLRDIISISGATLYFAKNGVEAIDICKMNNNIDLILMDIQMPVMDGVAASSLIIKFRHNILVIAQSAFLYEYQMADFKNSGFVDFLSKPYSPEQVFSVLFKYLK